MNDVLDRYQPVAEDTPAEAHTFKQFDITLTPFRAFRPASSDCVVADLHVGQPGSSGFSGIVGCLLPSL
jgi:hypothetical protein